ncbi:MAG: hypothetical protein WAN46_11035 [Gammaproteobacteria bacterium]|jgi:uncharacterized iron-regulated protein
MKRFFAAIAMLGTLSCYQAAADPSAQEAIEEAEVLQQKADSLQGGWMTTDELIAKAEAALAQGDNAEALALANQAKKEAALAYQQAERQQREWAPPPYLHQE